MTIPARLICIIFILLPIVSKIYAQEIFIEPLQIESNLPAGEISEEIINLANIGDEVLNWQIRKEILSEPHRNQLQPLEDRGPIRPQRDEPGDILREYDIRLFNQMAWDGNLMWGVDNNGHLFALNPHTSEIEMEYNIHESARRVVYVNGEFWIDSVSDPTNLIWIYNSDGELIDQFPFFTSSFNSLGFDPVRNLVFVHFFSDMEIWIYDVESRRVIGVFNAIENLNIPFEELSGIRCDYITWAPEHDNGHLWLGYMWRRRGAMEDMQYWAIQVNVNEDWELEEVQRFRIENLADFEHDGENLWVGWKVYDDGIDENLWLTYEPVLGELIPDADIDLTIQLNTINCIEGEYSATLHVLSNDDENPDVRIEISLQVTGIPDIDVEWEHDDGQNTIRWSDFYSEVFTGTEYHIPLSIINHGQGTLEIAEIICEGEGFSAEVGEITIPGRNEALVSLIFNSEEPDEYVGAVTIVSNAPDEEEISIDLIANSLVPPIIEIIPDEVVLDLSVNERSQQQIEIRNEGEATLRWRLPMTPFVIEEGEQVNGNDNDMPQRDDLGDLLLSYETPSEQPLAIAWDGEKIWYIDVSRRIFSIDPSTGDFDLLSLLDRSIGGLTFDGQNLWGYETGRRNIFTIYDLEGNLEDVLELPVWDSWGITSDLEHYIYANSHFDGKIHVISIEEHQVVTSIEYPEQIEENITEIIWVPTHTEGQLWGIGEEILYQFHVSFEDDWSMEVVNEFEWREEDGHYRRNLAHDGECFWQALYDDQRIIRFDDGIDDYMWVEIDPLEGELAAGEGEEIALSFDPSNLFERAYTKTVHIFSNDPVRPDLLFDITLNVEGIPAIDLRWELMGNGEQISWNNHFNEIFDFQESSIPIRVRNIGSSILVVDEIGVDNEVFSVNVDQLQVDVRDEESISVSFLPQESGRFEGNLRLSTNDQENPEVIIELVAEVADRPVVAIEPDEFDLGIQQGDNLQEEFRIFNEGEGRLRWEIEKRTLALIADDQLGGRAIRRIEDLPTKSPIPSRDLPGDVLRQYDVANPYTSGLAWDGELIWGIDSYPYHLTALDPNFGEVVHLSELPGHCIGLTFDGENLWTRSGYLRILYKLDRSGRVIDQFECRWSTRTLASDQNGHLIRNGSGHVYVNRQDNFETIADIDCEQLIHTRQVDAIEWVSEHENGELWLVTSQDIVYQFDIDENWNAELVQSFEIDDELNISHITHDGINLWASNTQEPIWRVIEDGFDEVHWLEVIPDNGEVARRRSQRVNFTVNTERLLGGNYAARLILHSNDPVNPDLAFPIRVTVIGSPHIETEPVARPVGGAVMFRFPEVIIGTECFRSIQIRNPGSSNLVIQGFEISAPDIFITDLEAGSIIEPFGILDILVQFDPQEPERYTEVFDIFTNAENVGEGDAAGHIWFRMEGAGINRPQLVTDPEAGADFPVVIVDGEDSVERILTIENDSEDGSANLEFSIRKEIIADERLQPEQGLDNEDDSGNQNQPHRDDPGETLGEFQVPYSTTGLAWDGEMMWGICANDRLWACDLQLERVIFDIWIDDRPNAITFHDGNLWVISSFGNVVGSPLDRYNLQGELLERIDLRSQFDLGMTSDDNGNLLIQNQNDGLIWVYSTETREFTDIRVDYANAIGGAEIASIEWVSEHTDGQLWGLAENHLYQLRVDEEWNIELENDFECDAFHESVGLAHDGTNLWVGMGNDNGVHWLVIDDGIEEPGILPWLTVDPGNGRVRPGRNTEVSLEFNSENIEIGEVRRGVLILETNDPENERIEFPVSLSVELPERELEFNLNQGWNLISLNVTPPEQFWERDEGPDVVRMTEVLRIDEDNHHIRLLKNEIGRFYAPAMGFNNIPYWDLSQGYLISVDEDLIALWFGLVILPDTDIPIAEGWNYIAYYPSYELNAAAPDYYVLSPIIENVIIAKDGEGNFLSPEWEFSNMPPWQETQGYQVKMSQDVVMNYPPQQEERLALVPYPSEETLCPWQITFNSPFNYSLLIQSISGISISEGDFIGAFNIEDKLVGLGRVMAEGRCGVAVWGDDPDSDGVEGLKPGEGFTLKYWRSDNNETIVFESSKIRTGGGLVWSMDGFSVIDIIAKSQIPEVFYLSDAYPNPFNSSTRIEFGLPEDSEIKLQIYDIKGRLVSVLETGIFQAGRHHVVWNATGFSSGYYFIRMQTAQGTYLRKALLVK